VKIAEFKDRLEELVAKEEFIEAGKLKKEIEKLKIERASYEEEHDPLMDMF